MAGAGRRFHVHIVVALLLLGTGCSGDDPPEAIQGGATAAAALPDTRSPFPPPTAAAPVRTARAAPAAGVVLAVVQESGPLTLYRLAPGSRRATRIGELTGPAAEARVVDVSLSGGTEPTVCATWELDAVANEDSVDFVSKLLCYAPGRRSGAEVAVSGDDPVKVGVRPDGRALAWSTYAPALNGRIDVARLDGAAVSEVRRFQDDPSRPEGSGAQVESLGWLNEEELAVGQFNQGDAGSGLHRFSVAPGQKDGWGDADQVVPPPTEFKKGYAVYEGVVGPAEDGTVLAVERGYYRDAEAPPGRAVRIALETGRVLEVVAFPREGRYVAVVSGSKRAALYLTKAQVGGEPVVSVRYAGESRGAPVTGLPEDVELAVAQP
jgi:hypothetical protein